MDVTLYTYLNFEYGFSQEYGEILGCILSFYNAAVILFLLPFGFYKIYRKEKQTLDLDEEFNRKFGQLY